MPANGKKQIDPEEWAVIKKRLTAYTKTGQFMLPTFVNKVFKDHKHIERLTDSQLRRLLIWMMPLCHTAYMSDLNEYYKSLTEGPDAKLSSLTHLIEAQDMYRVCRAIANERKVVRLAAMKKKVA